MPSDRDHQLSASRPSAMRYAVVAAVFCALGVGAALAFSAVSGRGPTTRPAAPVAAADVPAVAAAPVVNTPIDAPAGAATTPEAAVAQFLAAEQRGDFAASYARLTPDNRETLGTPARWIGAHADIPPVTGWNRDVVEPGDGTARVVGTVGLQPGLDEVAGLTPGSALATWEVVADGDEWFVDFEASSLEPRYAADDAADEAVLQWLAARQRCETAQEYDNGLLGRDAVAESLCGVDGDPRVGTARPLETAELDVLLPPFGADAGSWARAVDVTAPVPLRALVAPVGDDWLVVGVLEP